MKVVLKQDVKNIGKKGEIHEVSDGYARNFLLPRQLAVAADSAAVNEVKNKEAATQYHKETELAAAKQLAATLDGKTVLIKAKAGQGGKLFGSVTVKDIASKLAEMGFDIDKRKLSIDGKEIKTFGSFTVEAKVYTGVTAKFICKVEE